MKHAAKRYNDVLGMDIGASSVKLVWLHRPPYAKASGGRDAVKPEAEVVAAVIKPMPARHADSLAGGPALDAAILKSAVREIGCAVKNTFLCISGPGAYTKRLSVVSMPADELKEAVKWELKDQAHLDIEKSLIAHYILGQEDDKSGASRINILAAVADKSFIFNCVDAVSAAGLELLGITLSPFALAAACSSISQDIAAVLDIGSFKTELTLFKTGAPQFSRVLPGSGSEFTQALTGAVMSQRGRVELNCQDAECIKKEVGIPSDDVQILSMLRPVLERLVNELRRSFDYCSSQLKLPLPNKLYITGGGSLLKNLDKILAKELAIEVTYLGFAAARLKKKGLHQGAGEEPVFFDMAVAAALHESGFVDLIPPEVKIEKLERIEKASLKLVTLVCAGALLLSYLYMSVQAWSLKRQLDIGNANFNAMQEVISLKDKINKRKQILLQLNPGQHQSSVVLKALSRVVPLSMELDNLNRRDSGELDIKGTVAGNRPGAVLSGFMKSMQDTDVFKNIKIVSLEKQAGQDEISRFALLCEIR